MEWKDISDFAIDYFDDNHEDFYDTIDALDGWDGYLGDERRNPMWSIGDYFIDTLVKDIMRAALDGTDEQGSDFNPDREYFYWGGYGYLVSTDSCDYTDWLTTDFIKHLYQQYIKSKSGRWGFEDIPKPIVELFEQFYEETGLTDVWNQSAI